MFNKHERKISLIFKFVRLLLSSVFRVYQVFVVNALHALSKPRCAGAKPKFLYIFGSVLFRKSLQHGATRGGVGHQNPPGKF